MTCLKRLFCLHDYELISRMRNADDTIILELRRCKKCGKLKTKTIEQQLKKGE